MHFCFYKVQSWRFGKIPHSPSRFYKPFLNCKQFALPAKSSFCAGSPGEWWEEEEWGEGRWQNSFSRGAEVLLLSRKQPPDFLMKVKLKVNMRKGWIGRGEVEKLCLEKRTRAIAAVAQKITWCYEDGCDILKLGRWKMKVKGLQIVVCQKTKEMIRIGIPTNNRARAVGCCRKLNLIQMSNNSKKKKKLFH